MLRLVLVLITGILFASCSAESLQSTPTPVPIPQPQTYTIEYIVTHSTAGDISLTYENATGGTEQLETRASGGEWRQTYRLPVGAFAYISVQNKEDNGTVSCSIMQNGLLWKTSTSSGAYVIATCSGSVGSD